MKKKLILGLGKSNWALAKYYLKHQIDFDVFDDSVDDKFARFATKNKINYYHSKKYDAKNLDDYELVIKTPGINPRHNLLFYARRSNIKIVTEINVALDNFKGQLIAITGTNGKSSTTNLVYKMLKSANKDAHLVGNFGFPAIEVVDSTNEDSFFVMELSSFQLHYLKEIKPNIAIFTNISEDHLEWHVGYENYIEDKMNIIKNIDKDDLLIFNFDDELLKERAFLSQSTLLPTSTKQKLSENKVYYHQELFYMNGQSILATKNLKIKGDHNYQNITMALAVANHYNLEMEEIITFLKSYKGLEHRMQLIKQKPIRVYNDSKATNIAALNVGLLAMEELFVLIIGGVSKKEDINAIQWNAKCQHVFLYGQDGLEFEQFFVDHEIEYQYQYDFVQTVNDALKKAKQKSINVLLSPACASFDQHQSFEERGKIFTKLTKEYPWK